MTMPRIALGLLVLGACAQKPDRWPHGWTLINDGREGYWTVYRFDDTARGVSCYQVGSGTALQCVTLSRPRAEVP